MNIEPYTRVDSVKFGVSQGSVVKSLGKPAREGATKKGLVEFQYPNSFYRFDAAGTLVEISVNAPVVEFGMVSVPFKSLSSYLKQHDAGVFESVGFVVSPVFGVAFDPNFASWVTAFPRESLSEWKSVSKQ